MKNKIGTLIVLACLAVLLPLAVLVPQSMISPGKTMDAHADLATNCFGCHTPFMGSTSGKCIACHKVAEIGLKTTTGLSIAKEKKNVGFHQKLIEADCVACHSDHKGVQAFRPIGQFSHELLGVAAQKQCGECHRNPGDGLHQKVKGQCGACHTMKRWSPASFEHNEFFRFDRHHETQCATCHINEDYASYTCYGCHEHSRSKIREEHIEEGIYDYEVCVSCHRSGDEHEAKFLWRSRRSNTGTARFERHELDHGEHEEDDD